MPYFSVLGMSKYKWQYSWASNYFLSLSREILLKKTFGHPESCLQLILTSGFLRSSHYGALTIISSWHPVKLVNPEFCSSLAPPLLTSAPPPCFELIYLSLSLTEFLNMQMGNHHYHLEFWALFIHRAVEIEGIICRSLNEQKLWWNPDGVVAEFKDGGTLWQMTMLLPSNGVSQRSHSDWRPHLWIPATSCCTILLWLLSTDAFLSSTRLQSVLLNKLWPKVLPKDSADWRCHLYQQQLPSSIWSRSTFDKAYRIL